jgi:hypothetical protein
MALLWSATCASGWQRVLCCCAPEERNKASHARLATEMALLWSATCAFGWQRVLCCCAPEERNKALHAHLGDRDGAPLERGECPWLGSGCCVVCSRGALRIYRYYSITRALGNRDGAPLERNVCPWLDSGCCVAVLRRSTTFVRGASCGCGVPGAGSC